MANRRPSALNARRSRTVMLMARASSRECTACVVRVKSTPGGEIILSLARRRWENRWGRGLRRSGRGACVVALVEEIVEWIGPAFAVAGYWIVGAGVFADRSAFLGLIIPGDVVLALGGVFAAQGDLHLVWVIMVGVGAGLAGESTGYWLGRRYGARVLKRIPFANRLADRLDVAEEYFRRRGGRTVFIGRYVSLAGTFLPFVAGMSRMPYARFLAFDVPSVTLWAVGVSLLGYFLNSQLDSIDRILSRFGWGLLGLAVLFFGGRFVYRRFIARRPNEGSNASSGRGSDH